MQQHQIINSVLNLDTLFEQLTKLRFKGRQLIQQLINILFEREAMLTQSKKQSASIRQLIFESAQKNCLEFIGIQTAKIESQVIQNYVLLVQKVALNVGYLNKYVDQSLSLESSSVLGLNVIELICLAIDLGTQYQGQNKLIQNQWKAIMSQPEIEIFSQQKLKELMLHIGFESWIDDKMLECWREKLVVLSNQRYNPKRQ